MSGTLQVASAVRDVAAERQPDMPTAGSAPGALLRQSSKPLAGRVSSLEPTPLLASVLPLSDLADLRHIWLRGGFARSRWRVRRKPRQSIEPGEPLPLRRPSACTFVASVSDDAGGGASNVPLRRCNV